MEIFVVLITGFFFAWLVQVFINDHGLGYSLNLLVSTIGSFIGFIIYTNIHTERIQFWSSLLSCVLGAFVFITPIIIYSTRRKIQ